MSDPQTRDVERWFMRRGFTALLEGTSMRRRRAARLARTLAVVFVGDEVQAAGIRAAA